MELTFAQRLDALNAEITYVQDVIVAIGGMIVAYERGYSLTIGTDSISIPDNLVLQKDKDFKFKSLNGRAGEKILAAFREELARLEGQERILKLEKEALIDDMFVFTL